MSYLVFARKYRPQTFADILGQGPIVTTLTNAIRQKRIGQAYIFAGPRGTGKTSVARIFAKGLNCVEGPTVTPCLSCNSCQEIAKGVSLDVLEIDGASNRGIDQIRALRELAKFTPTTGTFKGYIIDEVHQITAEGFNALLKTLEEPPSHVLFILATTAPHKVPATILSRCQRYDFKRLPLEVITTKIKGIAAEEKLQIAEEAVIAIARAAGGSLRDAESLLDQAAAFAAGPIRGEDIHALLGTIDEDTFAQVISGIQAKDPVRLLRIVAEATNDGTDLIQWILGFLSFLRNLLVAKVGAGPLGFEDLGPEAIQRLTELAKGISIEELTLIVQVLTNVVETMRRVGDPRIPLEMALVRLSTSESMTSVTELLNRLDKMEQRLIGPGGSDRPAGSNRPTESAQPPAPPVARSTASAQSDISSPMTIDQVNAAWPTLLEELHRQKASAAAYLSGGSPVALEGEDPPQVVIGFSKEFEFHREALDLLSNRQLIEQALGTLLGRPVRCILKMVDQLPRPKADPSLLDTITELFEGRVLPGEG